MSETKELAEKILLALVSNPNFAPTDSDSDTAAACWDLAEAMQAQAEQRRAPEPDLDKPTIPPVGEFSKPQYSDDFEVNCWSEVPTRYQWWAKDKDGKRGFFVDEPVLCNIRDMWLIDKHSKHDFLNYYIDCPVDWRLSLRKRPSSK